VTVSPDVPAADEHREPPHEHRHEHFGTADAALLATAQGVRATWISLAVLATTAVAQAIVVTLTGSVALLADTIHNFTDALTAVPLLIAFRLGRKPAKPAERRSKCGKGQSDGNKSFHSH
jgi:Co/Zn/Cd efflux system component